HTWPHFLADGRHFLYLAQSADRSKTGIYVGSLESKDRRLLLPLLSEAKYSSTGHILFVRDRTLMAQRFDDRRLELEGEAFPVAESVAFNTGTGIGAFSTSGNGVLAYRIASSRGATSQLTWYDRSGKNLGAAA